MIHIVGSGSGHYCCKTDKKWTVSTQVQKPTEATITHKDEFGRILSEKEAYKQHSWKFHGVKPKAKKTEKRILKIENEIKATHANI